MSKITCCFKCVPPKRTPTCHSTCDDYLKERDAMLAEKAASNTYKELKAYTKEVGGKSAHENNLRYGRVKKPVG